MEKHLKDSCIYNCDVCGQAVTIEDSESDPPECCEKTMKKLDEMPVCELSETAEHFRFDAPGDPCDDGRG